MLLAYIVGGALLSLCSAYTINTAQIGPRLDGFGAISGGGGQSFSLFVSKSWYLINRTCVPLMRTLP